MNKKYSLVAAALALMASPGVLSCSSSSESEQPKQEPTARITKDLGPEGGSMTLTLSDGSQVSLAIPAGAISATTSVTLEELQGPVSSTSGLSLDPVLRFTPEGIVFEKTATLTWTPAPQSTVDLSETQWFYLNQERSVMPLLQEPKGAALEAKLHHFSDYAVANVNTAAMTVVCDHVVSTAVPVPSCFDGQGTLDAILRCGAYFGHARQTDGDSFDQLFQRYLAAAEKFSTDTFNAIADAPIPKGDYCLQDASSEASRHLKELAQCMRETYDGAWNPSDDSFDRVKQKATVEYMQEKAREFLRDTSIPEGDVCLEGAAADYQKMAACIRNHPAIEGADIIHQLEVRYVQTLDQKCGELAAYTPKTGECEWYHGCLEKLIRAAELIEFDEAMVSDANIDAMKDRKKDLEDNPEKYHCAPKELLYDITVIVHSNYEQPSVEPCSTAVSRQEATLRYSFPNRLYDAAGCASETDGKRSLVCAQDSPEDTMAVVLSNPIADWNEGPVNSSQAFVSIYREGGATRLDFNFHAESSTYLDPGCSGEMTSTVVQVDSNDLATNGELSIPFDDTVLKTGKAHTYTNTYKSEDQCDIGCYSSFEIDIMFEPRAK